MIILFEGARVIVDYEFTDNFYIMSLPKIFVIIFFIFVLDDVTVLAKKSILSQLLYADDLLLMTLKIGPL